MRRLLAVLALAACSPSTEPPDPAGRDLAALVAGDWRLTHIEARPLPFTLAVGDNSRTEIVAATLTLEADGTWRRRVTYRETRGGVATEDVRELSGLYTGDQSIGPVTLRFRTSPDFTIVWTGILSGNTLTLSGFAESWRFAR